MRVAVMQPYFLPYAGYFRLFCNVDAFVVLDDVQFPRRGWVHRNRLRRHDGQLAWLTLPLAHAPRDTLIRDLAFHPRADSLWPARTRAFPACDRPGAGAMVLVQAVNDLGAGFVDYQVRLLQATLESLGLPSPPLIRAGEAGVEEEFPGAAGRIIGLCRRLGADTYLNAPGGRTLYDAAVFARHGILLEFLPPYRGDASSILQRLNDERPETVRREIADNLA